MDILSNYILNIYVYSHRLVQLSALVGDASYCWWQLVNAEAHCMWDIYISTFKAQGRQTTVGSPERAWAEGWGGFDEMTDHSCLYLQKTAWCWGTLTLRHSVMLLQTTNAGLLQLSALYPFTGRFSGVFAFKFSSVQLVLQSTGFLKFLLVSAVVCT